MTQWALIAVFLVTAPSWAQAAGKTHGDVRRGWGVFVAKSCARCHATWGQGGDIGPDLGRTRAGGLTDAELAAAMWNHVPRMWGRMQEEGIPHVAISDAEMADLFAYLSFVRALDEPGDPEIGRRLLSQKKCGVCHSVEHGKGAIAPDLRRWAQYRNPAVWAKLMFDHAPKMVEAMHRRGIAPPSLEARELVHIVSYIRSVSVTAEAELLEPGDPAEGERLFHERGCIKCHSVRGEGGKIGPNLGNPGWATSFTGVAIKVWNRGPGMRAAMAANALEAPNLTPQEMAHVIAYLFAVTYSDQPGSAAAGVQVLQEKGCARCHEAGVGPVFDRFRGRATPVTVAQALWNHGPTMLERMRDLGIRWPTLSGQEMSDLLAALNAKGP